MVRIAVLQHKRQKVDNMLMIHHLGAHWQEQGYHVTFYNGLDHPVEGDILIPQVDLTITPPEYVEAIMSFKGKVLNRSIHDISKRKVSEHLVDPGSDYQGEVIVKPNLNSNGYPELRLKSKLGKGIHLLKKMFGFTQRGYEVYPSLYEVPDIFKKTDYFVIEKFLPRRDGDEYIIGLTSFLGDGHRSIELQSKDAIIKGNSLTSRRVVETPPEVLRVRERLKFDYGKFDYSFHKGKLVLFDTNNTPGGAGSSVSAVLARPGPGIEYYISQI